MTPSMINAALEAELAEVAQATGCELLHVEYAGGALRIILDRPEGVTLADCESVSRQLSPILDVSEFGDRSYTLEVSSPGLDRQLFRPKDYERYRGHRVRVTFTGGDPRRKQTLIGQLEDFVHDHGGRLILVEDEHGERLDIPLSEVQVARLVVDFDQLSAENPGRHDSSPGKTPELEAPGHREAG